MMILPDRLPYQQPSAPPLWNEMIRKELQRFPLYMQRRKPQMTTSYHRQPGWEIHLTHEGAGALMVGERHFLLMSRQVTLFEGSLPHQMITPHRLRRTVICIGPELLRSGEGILGCDLSWTGGMPVHGQLSVDAYTRFNELAESMDTELRERSAGYAMAACSSLLALLTMLQRQLVPAPGQAPEPASGPISVLIQSSMDYIRRHLKEELSLTRVAECFGVSPEHLSRCFSKELGIGFQHYLQHQRIAESRRLLASSPELSITEVALSAGFESASHFSRLFRRLTGMTASEFRNQQWKEDI